MTPEEKEVRRNLIGSLVAGIAQASGVSGAEAVFAATNETENNYLKPDELKSYLAALQAWKDCKGGACKQAEVEVRRLQAISTERNYAADSACLENPGACAAAAQELRADISALEEQAKSLDRTEAATAANNLLQARKQYYSNLEWRAYAAQQELEAAGNGSWLASMSGQELYESGYLTQQEAQDLQAMRRETLAAAFVPPALAAGLKGGGSAAGRRIQSAAEEAKASALSGAKSGGFAGELTGITQRQLDKKFKHASDFGVVTTKKNPETLAQFESAIRTHMSSVSTVQQGTYGFVKDSKVFFNAATNNAVVVDGAGNFVTGFKLSPGTQQYENFIKNGVLR